MKVTTISLLQAETVILFVCLMSLNIKFENVYVCSQDASVDIFSLEPHSLITIMPIFL